jgi:sugar lactone lactonase YvrE
MKIEDDNGISSLLRSEDTVLCGSFGFTEGPVWVAADNALLFSDIPGNRTHRWRPGTSVAEVYRDPSGWANGLTLDHLNRLVACETRGQARFERGVRFAFEARECGEPLERDSAEQPERPGGAFHRGDVLH